MTILPLNLIAGGISSSPSSPHTSFRYMQLYYDGPDQALISRSYKEKQSLKTYNYMLMLDCTYAVVNLLMSENFITSEISCQFCTGSSCPSNLGCCCMLCNFINHNSQIFPNQSHPEIHCINVLLHKLCMSAIMDVILCFICTSTIQCHIMLKRNIYLCMMQATTQVLCLI